MKNTFQKVIAACLALLILLSALPVSVLATGTDAVVGWDGTVATGYESGTGTADDPYIIVDGAQLAYFASVIESEASSYADTYFELGADIALNDTTNWEAWGTTDENGYTIAPVNVWEPIGDAYNDIVFCGTLDGKGHTISGIYISGTKDDIGLFSGLGGGAVLKNVNVAASYIKGDENVAALVGAMESPDSVVTISGCSASGNITAKYISGGLVGYAYSYYADRLVIAECVNYATVTSSYNNAGGIVGEARNAIVTACVNNGTVTGDGEVGGIGGYISNTQIVSSVNNGAVSGDYVGGVAGRVYASSVVSSVNTADLVNDESVGGIVYSLQENSVLRDCRNEGDITSESAAAAGICINLSISSIEQCENYGVIVSKNDDAAGIVTSAYGGNTSNADAVLAKIVRCANHGAVTGIFNASGIGDVENGIVCECANHGNLRSDYNAAGLFVILDNTTVSDCYNTGSVAGYYRESGFAESVSDSTVTNCYTRGAVISDGYEYTIDAPFANSVDNSTLTGCYYLVQTNTESDFGEYLSEEQAVLVDSYENYDFLSVWETGHDEEYAYPTLRFFGSKSYQYRIAYQDGGELIKTAIVSAGEAIDLTPPENEEYLFAYWKTADGARYGVTDTVPASANITLTAVWTVKNASAHVWDGSIDTDWAGNGTEDDPYLITVPAELAGLGAVLGDRDTYYERYYEIYDDYFKQTTDLLMNDGGDCFGETMIGQNEWNPIDDFQGHYDGDGYAIRGIYIHADSDYVGVFGESYADLSNITLQDSYIYCADGEYVGGIAGRANDLTDCYSDATVHGYYYVGGVVGYAYHVNGCENHGAVQGTYYVGGVVGQNTASENGAVDCFNDGAVKGYQHVGGVTGYAYAVENCENSGIVEGFSYVGGIAGQDNDYLANCINRGTVAGDEYVGGVVGYGNVDGAVNHGDVSGRTSVGGVIGVVNGISADSYSTGDVRGESNVGGVAGQVSWEASLATSYAVGAVTATSEEYGNTVGGVIGSMTDDATLTDCYYLDTGCAVSNAYGTALTDAQMKTEDAYAGFNFLKSWERGYDSSYPYPTLREMGSKEYRYKIILISNERVFADRTYYMGVTVNLAPPVSDTYDFAYWMAEDGTRYYADDVIKASEDMTLTAVWKVRPSGHVWDGRVDTVWAGSGTMEDPYLITTVDELVGIAAYREEVWWEDFENTYFKQTADLVVNAGGDQFSDTIIGRYEWEPIAGFGGHYDGDGHTISGIYMNSYTRSVGLFENISGSLKNLTLTDSYLVSHYSYAGGLAVEIGGTVENCHNGAYVCSTVNNAGGIAASGWSDEEYAARNCSNSGTVIGAEWVGGIFGSLHSGIVSDCSNSGYVYGSAEGARYVGGIVGDASDTVANCLNSGTVQAVYYVGGIVGDTTSSETVSGCVNVGTVIGLDCVGGIVGDNSATLTNSYNSGTVTLDIERFGALYGGYYFGGIAGSNDGTIIGVYNTGEVIGSNGTGDIGGVVGYSSNTLREAYSIGTVTVGENCESVGAVIGNNSGTAESLYYADSSMVTDAYATALSADRLTTAEAYSGFDFETNWSIDPTNADYPYPTLTGAPHKQYVTVAFVDPNGRSIASYRLEKGTEIPYPDMASYNYEDAEYVYEFVSWSSNPTTASRDTTITASFRKVAKLFFTSIEKELTVGYGYSRTNLQIDLESLFGEVICTSTTDYCLLSRVTWDLHGYDPTVVGDVVISGYLTLTDSPYYAMAEDAIVTVTVTVLPEGDTTHIFEANDLLCETRADGTLTVIGYNGDAQVVYIPSTINGKTVTVIGENAFASNAAVVSVTLPATVHTVEAGAFENAAALAMIVLPDGLQTVGERAFYNTALADVTCPASLTTIGEYAFGYYGNTATAVDGFTVYAFDASSAATYAAENGFVCVATQTAVDSESAVSAVIPAHLSLAVVAVGEGVYHDTAMGIFTETDGVQLMDLSLYDDDTSVQPGGVMTVSLPIPDGFDAADCHIFRINDDGSYKDMQAAIVDGRLVFSTAHLSVYAVVEQHADSVLVGDVTGDGALNMRDALRLYQITSGKIENDMPPEVADVTGDGIVSVRDALRLYQIVSA